MLLPKNKRRHRPIAAIIFALAYLALASSALAETFTGGNNISVVVPDGWYVAEHNQEESILSSPIEECLFAVQVLPNTGSWSTEEVSGILAERANAGIPEKMPGRDAYAFDGIHLGAPFITFVLASSDTVISITELGLAGKYEKELRLIRAGLRSDDSAVQKMLDVLK